MGTKRIVVDTNVLISAFGWSGKPRILFQQIVDGKYELILSEKQFLEMERVLSYPKFHLSSDEKQRFLDILGNIAYLVETHNDLSVIKEDPSDNMLLEAAVENGVGFIITGDNHLLKLKEYREIKIVTPAQFLAMK